MDKKNIFPAFFQRILPKSLGGRSSVIVIVLVALLIEATSVIQYWFASRGIREEVEHRAKTELKVKSMEIRNVMSTVEVATNNMVWAAEELIDTPDSLYTLLRRIVKDNSIIVGCGVTFVADYYPEKGHWFEPYVAERDNGDIDQGQIGGPTHDYLNAEWHLKGMEAGKGYWSEPYYDNAGARMMLCTYTMPLHDKTGRTVGLLGSDVSLNWLGSVINARHIYPSSYNLMISRQGTIMACPVESLVMQRTIQEATSDFEDTMVRHINDQMLSGQSGQATVYDEKGAKNYIFFAPVEGETGWSMAVVCSDREIYYSLRQVGFNLQVLMLLGMALLGYIIWRAIKSARRLETAQTQKAAIENELRIASAIQMALLPKIFPAYPDRTDVDIHATLTPAKEVGGDLYDFFMLGDRLYFCVGDVSGKGVPASMTMAVVVNLFRTVAKEGCPPEVIANRLNDTLSADNENSMFVTMFIGVIDLKTGRLDFCNCGHNPPMLGQHRAHTSQTVFRYIETESNAPIGLWPELEYVGEHIDGIHDHSLFVYTDGVSEAENGDHEQFGEKRMLHVLNESSQPFGERIPKSRSHYLVDRMKTAVEQFTGDAEQSDDLTVFCVQIK